jgi:hypothetical protein
MPVEEAGHGQKQYKAKRAKKGVHCGTQEDYSNHND